MLLLWFIGLFYLSNCLVTLVYFKDTSGCFEWEYCAFLKISLCTAFLSFNKILVQDYWDCGIASYPWWSIYRSDINPLGVIDMKKPPQPAQTQTLTLTSTTSTDTNRELRLYACIAQCLTLALPRQISREGRKGCNQPLTFPQFIMCVNWASRRHAGLHCTKHPCEHRYSMPQYMHHDPQVWGKWGEVCTKLRQCICLRSWQRARCSCRKEQINHPAVHWVNPICGILPCKDRISCVLICHTPYRSICHCMFYPGFCSIYDFVDFALYTAAVGQTQRTWILPLCTPAHQSCSCHCYRLS